MKLHPFLVTSVLAMFLTSCGQSEDQPQPDIVVDSPLEKVTFSITTGEMSRASSEEDLPTRAFMYIKDSSTGIVLANRDELKSNNGSFNFEIELQKTHKYDIAFWADGEDYVLDPEKGMESITYKDASTGKPGIAYAYQESGFSPKGSSAQITLKHAVGQLIIREAKTLDENDEISIKFDRPNYSYSAISGKYTRIDPTPNVSLTFIADAATKSGDLISAFMLAPKEGPLMIDNLYLSYTPTGDTEANNQTISVIPIHANKRTIIEGVFKDLSTVTYSFSVNVETGWEEDVPHPSDNEDDPGNDTPPTQGSVIALSSTVRLTNDMLTEKLSGATSTLKITGEMKDADFKVLRDYFSVNGTGENMGITLDLGNAQFSTMPDYAFSLDGEDIYDQTPINPMTGISAIVLPEGLTEIPMGAFIDCQNLKSITIPSSVKTLGELSLYRCGITELNAPSVTYVDVDAVEGCPNLMKITLGDLTHVGNNAFRDCPSLKEMDLTKCSGVPTGNNYIFGVDSSTTPAITIYVASTAIANSFEANNYWNYKKHNWVVR